MAVDVDERHYRVARQAADTMSKPFARDEERAAHVEAERVVFEWGPVPIAHQKADQTLVGVVHLVLAPGEADASRIHHREVGRHGVVEPDEAMVEDTDGVLGYHSVCRGHR